MPRLVATAAGWIAGATVAVLLLRAVEIVVFGFDILAEEDWARLADLIETGNYTLFASWRSMTWPVVSLAGVLGLAASAYGLGRGAALIHDRLVDLATERAATLSGRDARKRLPWQIRHPRLHIFLVSLGIVDRPRQPSPPVMRPPVRTGHSLKPGIRPMTRGAGDEGDTLPAASSENLTSGSLAAAAPSLIEHRSRPPRPWSRRGGARPEADPDEPEASDATPSPINPAANAAAAGRPADADVPAPADIAVAPDGVAAPEPGGPPAHQASGPTGVVDDLADGAEPAGKDPSGLADPAAADPVRLVSAFRRLIEDAAGQDHPERDLEDYHAALAQRLSEGAASAGPASLDDMLAAVAAGLPGADCGKASVAPELAAATFRRAVTECLEAAIDLPERPPAADPALIGIWEQLMTAPPAMPAGAPNPAPDQPGADPAHVPADTPHQESACDRPRSEVLATPDEAADAESDGERGGAASAPDSAGGQETPSAHDEMVEADWALHRRLEDDDLAPPASDHGRAIAAADAVVRGDDAIPAAIPPAVSLPDEGPPGLKDERAPTGSGRGRRQVVDVVAGELARNRWAIFRDVGLGEDVGGTAESLVVADLVALSADRLVVVIVSGLRGRVETAGDVWSDADGEAFGPVYRARFALDEADANLAGLAALRRHRRDALVVLDSCRPSHPVASGDRRIVLAQVRDGAVEGQALPTPLDALGGPAEPIHRTSEAMAILESRERTGVVLV